MNRSDDNGHLLIFYYTGTGRYAMNVLAGALVANPATRDISILFPDTFSRLRDTIRDAAQKRRKTLVCWSFFSAGFGKAGEELASLRHTTGDGDVRHIAGGVHATAEPLQTLQAGFDYVACGEGEQIIVDLVTAFQRNQALDRIRGLNYLRNGTLSRNGRGETIVLDNHPPHCARYKKYGPMEITRGCIYACKFCQTPFVNKARFRHRSIGNIAKHVRTMHDNGLRDYRFLTPTSLSYGSPDESVNLPAIEELLGTVRGIIGPDKRIFYGTFPSEVRPEHISRQALAILKKYVHNDNLIIGGQSGSQHMLDITRRGHSVEVIEQAVRYCIEYGFKPNVDFIFGMPGESEEDAELTRMLTRKLVKLGARIHSHTFMPLPGTPLQHTAAGKVDKLTQAHLENLTAEGLAYGKWKEQIKIAEQLSAFNIPKQRR